MMSQIRYIRVTSTLLRNRTCLSYMLPRGNHGCYSTAAENPTKEVAPVATQREATSSKEDAKNLPNSQAALASLTLHRVDNIDKMLLVWGGKYKSKDEVPKFVRQDTMERARNKARIKISLMMAGATAIACMIMIMSGKKAQKRGESVTKMNEEWHKQIKEEAKQKDAATAAAQGAK